MHLFLLTLFAFPWTNDSPIEVAATEIIRGPADDPRAVLRVTLHRPIDGDVQVTTADGTVFHEASPTRNAAGASLWLPAPLPAAGDVGEVTVVVTEEPPVRIPVSYPRPESGHVMHFVPGFHYDPVWWNTQAHYTETGRYLDAHTGPGLTLVAEYLRKLDEDDDYAVAFHQLPYLKTFVEAHPSRLGELSDWIARGRAGLVGGTYNELSTTLVSAESTIRNAIYGMLFQREVLGGEATTFWQCDVFGHDPSFPTLMAQSGHDAGAFARGPFHQWGIDRDEVNFPSEFLWMSPDGRSVLTHYMTGHYGYAYARFATGANQAPEDPARSDALIAEMFEDLRVPALTRHVLLPMHTDFIRPLENLGDVVRAWNETHVSPRAVIDTSTAFFRAVRQEVARTGVVVPVITRDMNPIYTGCAVSFADLKLANREAESALRDAEIAATLAALSGAPYPTAAIDRAWRQLLFCAHHDGVTGSMSDQVYLDVMASYRDALWIAGEVRDRSLAFLEDRDPPADGTHRLWNTTSSPRREWHGISGAIVEVPPVGFTSVRASAAEPTSRSEVVLENEHLRLEVDPARGGTITSLIDKRTGREQLLGPANDLVVWDEYKTLPGQGEGPWHLAPTGHRENGQSASTRILPVDPRRPHAIIVESEHGLFRSRRTVELLPGSRRVDCETWILDWRGRDKLVRVEFPVDLPHARPIYQTAAAVVGRNFARDVDAAVDPWTLDQSLWQFVELGTTCTVELDDDGETVTRRAIAVAELRIPADATAEHRRLANRLAEALVAAGVTSTIVEDDARPYGDLALDSNAPDVRVEITRHGHGTFGQPYVGVDEDGNGTPIVRISPTSVGAVCQRLVNERRIVVDATRLTDASSAPSSGFAVISAGPASAQVREDGTIALNLLRSNTSWPAGVWIDPPARRLPDGAPIETMHGDHLFRYSLYPHEGDYRDAGVAREAQDRNQPLISRAVATPGDGPASRSFLSIEPRDVLLTALKPKGNPTAEWRSRTVDPRRDGVVTRLWNGAGAAVEAVVRLPHHGIARAWRVDLLERRVGELSVAGGAVRVALKAHETASLLLLPADVEGGSVDATLDPVATDAAPAAYWLENLGEGVTGNGEVAVVPAARELVVDRDEVRSSVTLVNHRRDDAVTLHLTTTAPESAFARLGADRVTLAPASSVTVPLTLTPREGIKRRTPGLVEITATLDSPARVVTAAVWIASEADHLAAETVTIEPLARVVGPGSPLRVRVHNRTYGPIRGVAAWLSPMSTWDAIAEWRRELVLPANGSVDWEVPVHGDPRDSFALLRFTYGGRIAYGPPVALVTDGQRAVLAFEVDRVRLKKGARSQVVVTAHAVRGLEADTVLDLDAPEGTVVTEASRFFRQEAHDARLTVVFDVAVRDGGGRGMLLVRSEGGGASEVPYAISPVQAARPTGVRVVVDGDLGEWSEEEFTRATGPRGEALAAARYGTAGLTFAMRVKDDVFHQTHSDATLWEGDSVQLALSLSPGETLGYSARDFEFGVAKTPDGPRAWCWYGGDGGATGEVTDAAVAVVRGDGETVYEFRIPRSALGRLPLKPGSSLGFSYIANDNDGDGYAGATEWTPGMVGAKDASLFGELLLSQEDSS